MKISVGTKVNYGRLDYPCIVKSIKKCFVASRKTGKSFKDYIVDPSDLQEFFGNTKPKPVKVYVLESLPMKGKKSWTTEALVSDLKYSTDRDIRRDQIKNDRELDKIILDSKENEEIFKASDILFSFKS
jgi:hypothetical protein